MRSLASVISTLRVGLQVYQAATAQQWRPRAKIGGFWRSSSDLWQLAEPTLPMTEAGGGHGTLGASRIALPLEDERGARSSGGSAANPADPGEDPAARRPGEARRCGGPR